MANHLLNMLMGDVSALQSPESNKLTQRTLQMTHEATKSPYDQFAQQYPQLDAYGRKVASGGFLKENINNFSGALDNAQGQMFEGKADSGQGNILDYFAPAAMTAFHGSPHKFDKFSMDNIGTGEGAQAYGHGLYFAENPKVANQYKDSFNAQGGVWKAKNKISSLAQTTADANGKDLNSAISEIRRLKKQYPTNKALGDMTERYDAAISELNDLKKTGEFIDEAQIYEVDIPDHHIKNFLDWDAPLSEQPESVRKALEPIIEKTKKINPELDVDNITGQGLYKQYSVFRGNNPDFASEGLSDVGIKGIKYYDGSSRAAGEGTRNLVVFDDSIVKTLKRNGESITPTADELLNQINSGDIPEVFKPQSGTGSINPLGEGSIPYMLKKQSD